MQLQGFNIEKVKNGNENTKIVFSGNLILENGPRLSENIKEHCNTPEDIVVELSDVDEIDLCMLQLLISLIKNRNNKKLGTSVIFNLSEPDTILLKKVGFLTLISDLQNKNKQ